MSRLVGKVGAAAGAKVLATGVSGLLGVLISRLIISSFGVISFAEYGLLATLAAVIPFADLGLSAAVINAVSTADDKNSSMELVPVIAKALRLLMASAFVLSCSAFALGWWGFWPTVLGKGLVESTGNFAASLCLILFACGIPLSIGQSILIGLRRNASQILIIAAQAPLTLLSLYLLSRTSQASRPYIAAIPYAANLCCLMLCILVARRHLPGVLAASLRLAVSKTKIDAAVWDVAGPMLAQMLVLPLALQTDRVVLSHVGGVQELARYSLAYQMFGLILQVIAAAGMSLWPTYAKARSAGESVSPFAASATFGVCAVVAGLSLTAVIPFAAAFVSTGKLQVTISLSLAFTFFLAVQGLKYPLGMFMTDAAGLRFQVLPIVLMVLVKAGLAFAFVPHFGAVGAMASSAVAVLACQVVPNALYVRRHLRRSGHLVGVA